MAGNTYEPIVLNKAEAQALKDEFRNKSIEELKLFVRRSNQSYMAVFYSNAGVITEKNLLQDRMEIAREVLEELTPNT